MVCRRPSLPVECVVRGSPAPGGRDYRATGRVSGLISSRRPPEGRTAAAAGLYAVDEGRARTRRADRLRRRRRPRRRRALAEAARDIALRVYRRGAGARARPAPTSWTRSWSSGTSATAASSWPTGSTRLLALLGTPGAEAAAAGQARQAVRPRPAEARAVDKRHPADAPPDVAGGDPGPLRRPSSDRPAPRSPATWRRTSSPHERPRRWGELAVTPVRRQRHPEEGILDPQGRAVEQSLPAPRRGGVGHVRVGRDRDDHRGRRPARPFGRGPAGRRAAVRPAPSSVRGGGPRRCASTTEPPAR